MSRVTGFFGRRAVMPVSASLPVPENLTDGRHWGEEFIAAMKSGGGVASAEKAARVSAVYFCVSIIATLGGALPREFRDPDNRIVSGDWLTELVDVAPNGLQTGDEFWASMLFRAAIAGQAFAEPVNGPLGPEIWPLEPLRTEVQWRERDFTVIHTGENGVQRRFGPMQVFWISGLADGGVKPLTPWKMARDEIDFALALESQGTEFFRNGTRHSGVLTTSQVLNEEVIERLKDGIRRWKNGGTPVLEQGLDFKDASTTNVDAQMQELIKQRTIELARYWHIPLSFVSEDAGKVGNAEQDALGLVKYVLRPWCRRVEQAIRQRLMTPDQRRRMSPKFNLDALLRGDSSTQHRNAVLARTASTLSANEIRTGWFDLPRINEPWADDPQAPLNSNRAADTTTGGMTAPQDRSNAQRGSTREMIRDMMLEDLREPEQ